MSITPLAGWAGQLSLGQFAFVGLGALTMLMFHTGLGIPVPFDLGHALRAGVGGHAARDGCRCGRAIAIGIPALRAESFLAVITLRSP
jgi:ABC-type branched-subunit amino acid transport system permease subunit